MVPCAVHPTKHHIPGTACVSCAWAAEQKGKEESEAKEAERDEEKPSKANEWLEGSSKKNPNNRVWNDTRKDKDNGKGPSKQLDKK